MTLKHVSDSVHGEDICFEIEPLTPDRVHALRETYGLSQSEFSKKFGIPLSTLQKWEQGSNLPSTAAAATL